MRRRVRKRVRSEVDRSVVPLQESEQDQLAHERRRESAQNSPTVGSNSSWTPISANDGNFSSTGQVSPNTE